jgi:hypothetical protein
LRLPLLTKRERRNLNGFWFSAVHRDFIRVFRGDEASLKLSIDIAYSLDEFAAAINWIEEMKA